MRRQGTYATAGGAILVACLTLALGCGTPVAGPREVSSSAELIRRADWEHPPQKPSRTLGKFVYQKHCAQCHGMVKPELPVPGTVLSKEAVDAMDAEAFELRKARLKYEKDVLGKELMKPGQIGPYNDLYEYKWYNNGSDFADYSERGLAPLVDYTYHDLFELISHAPHGDDARGFHDFQALLSDRERWAVIYYIANIGLDNGELDWRAEWDAQLGARKNVYGTNCSICHGAVGRGDGPEGHTFMPKPMNFNYMDWSAGVKPNYPVSDMYLYDIIANGKISPGSNTEWTGMPWWKDHFREEDMWGLVEYIRSLSYEWD